MKVLPDDLANLCALFVGKRVQPIRASDLLRRVRDGLRIDSVANPEEIVNEAVLCGLVKSNRDRYRATTIGKAVGKAQGSVRNTIAPSAKEVLLRRVYLSKSSGERCCGDFMRTWDADVDNGTFALNRGKRESIDTLVWLCSLTGNDVVTGRTIDWANVSHCGSQPIQAVSSKTVLLVG